jgi:hypothetical protein
MFFVTLHTSHVTHLTSHVTRHTSHVPGQFHHGISSVCCCSRKRQQRVFNTYICNDLSFHPIHFCSYIQCQANLRDLLLSRCGRGLLHVKVHGAACHTSHVTRYTSHVTPHTSHALLPGSQPGVPKPVISDKVPLLASHYSAPARTLRSTLYATLAYGFPVLRVTSLQIRGAREVW